MNTEPEFTYRVAFENAEGSTFEKVNPTIHGPRIPVVGEIIIFNSKGYLVRQVRWYTQPGNRVKAHLRATDIGNMEYI